VRGEYASAGKTLVLVAVFMDCGLRFEMGRDEVSKKKKKWAGTSKGLPEE